MQNLSEVSELLISHLVDLVDLLLEVELIVLLADVGVVLLDGLLDVGLALFHDLDVLRFGFGCVVKFSELFSDLFECPCAGWAHVAFCYDENVQFRWGTKVYSVFSWKANSRKYITPSDSFVMKS